MTSRKLMEARRRFTIVRELVAVAPGAPLFLTLMLDIPVDRPLGLTRQQTQPPKEVPMFQIVSAGGDVVVTGFQTYDAAEMARLRYGRTVAAYNFATVEEVK